MNFEFESGSNGTVLSFIWKVIFTENQCSLINCMLSTMSLLSHSVMSDAFQPHRQ